MSALVGPTVGPVAVGDQSGLELTDTVEFDIGPFDDPIFHVEVQKATILLTVNFIFGAIFVIGMIMTIVMMVRRDINDLFLRYAMYCMILALALSSVMCFRVTSYDTFEYMGE